MKKYVSLLLIIIVLLSNVAMTFGQGAVVALTDIEDHWIKDNKEILYFLQHIGVFMGYSDNTFKPQNPITREEFIKLLTVAIGEGERGNSSETVSFQDVPKGHWSHQYVEAAVELGIIIPLDYSNGLEPQRPITRQEISVMLARAMVLFGGTLNTGIANTVFKDDADMSEWVKPYIQQVYEAGLMQGYEAEGGFTFGPLLTTTRAEAAMIIYRLIGLRETGKTIAFYAIDSYKQVDTIQYFDEVVFGWSALTLDAEGRTILTLNSADSRHRLPSAYQEPLNKAKENAVAAKLMVTEARTSVIYPLLQNTDMQQAFIDDAIKAIKDLGMSGLVMDLENIRDTEKGNKALYVSFLKDLQAALSAESLTLSVAVQPDNVVGYYDGFDYKEIAKLVEDVILMAHDYHDRNTLSYVTDHAPIQKVQGAILSLLNQGVAKESLILALQVAGATQIRSQGNQGNAFYAPTMSTVYDALNTRNGQQSFDYITMTPSFSYVDEAEAVKGTIRFENKTSINAKIQLAKFYGLKGISFWRIGELQQDVLELLQ